MGTLRPASLVLEYIHLFEAEPPGGPVLDLASGEGHNGIYLATRGIPVVLCDVSGEALERGKIMAKQNHAKIAVLQADLEQEGVNPLPENRFGGILVFRYLHRPLIPCIRKSLRNRGLLLYETFTTAQPAFGKPHNPNYLLKPGELLNLFKDWEIIHYFEGVLEGPKRASARIVCRKPP